MVLCETLCNFLYRILLLHCEQATSFLTSLSCGVAYLLLLLLLQDAYRQQRLTSLLPIASTAVAAARGTTSAAAGAFGSGGVGAGGLLPAGLAAHPPTVVAAVWAETERGGGDYAAQVSVRVHS